MTAQALRFLPLTALLLVAMSAPAQAGTPEAPEVTDPAGDMEVAGLDVTGVWFEANATTLLVHIVRAGDTPTPVECAQGQCLGAGAAVRVVFNVLRPDGSPAPTPEGGYNGTYVLVRLGPEDGNLSSAVGHYDSDNVAQPTGPANLTRDGALLTVAVPLDHPDLALPLGPTPGAYRLNGTYALSYALACLPDPGQEPPAPAPNAFACRMYNQPAPDATAVTVWQPYWDRAPDTGAGLDFVFASPTPEPPAAAPSTTTLTVTQTQTKTRTTTGTVTETVTSTPLPIHVEAKSVPAAGLGLAGAALAAGLLARRRLA